MAVAAGIALTVTGSVGTAIGMSLVKYAHMELDNVVGKRAGVSTFSDGAYDSPPLAQAAAAAMLAGEDQASSPSGSSSKRSGSVRSRSVPLDAVRCCRRRSCQRASLVIGNAMLALMSPVFDLLALYYAPLEVISPFAAATLLLNAIIAPALVGEALHVVDMLSAVLIVPGVVLVSVFGPSTTPELTLESAAVLADSTAFMVWESAIGVALVTAAVIARCVFARARKERRLPRGHPLVWPMIAALLGAQQMLCSKIVLSLVHTSVAGGPMQFDSAA
eukprot:CAMPEP_0203822494 /NCGR_PEP_ID=MMETSP0115-20131106/46371_1 /ASSEMBLY_ACC=CAM_ASM_000227 /TAXON_ID=33651 /ORGANISM="Bicosoecid sp, Strain ms1" /LENGTH=275 /DNA_ID=CAMNT_0050731527 /DNA_START=63 /DNA_END=886 /DNA_ORIENTATION=-